MLLILLANIKLVHYTFVAEDGETWILPPQHSMGSLQRGRETRSQLPSEFVVDILSVGSLSRLDQLDAQRETMASHVTVRNFFNVTEHDDEDDPECYQHLTWPQVRNISRFCRGRGKKPVNSSVYRVATNCFADVSFLKKKANPGGWICAQKRPHYGLSKAAKHYAKHPQEDLPDWLIIMDDDTYYNMELFYENFRHRDASDLEISVGCLIHLPLHFTVPYGGYGSVISRASLAKLLRPIECPSADDQAICDRLRDNLVGELRHFRNGMSLIDLFHRYVSAERYRDVDRWSAGFCMHSDVLLGYLVNFYNASRHVADPNYEMVSHARIEPFVKGSEIKGSEMGHGLCRNKGVCPKGAEVCHYAPAAWMEEETDRWRQLVPHRFRHVAAYS
jgi:hypothetical protein